MDPAQIAQLFTIKEAASILGLSIATLRRYDKIGILSPVRTPGNQRRYLKEDVHSFLNNELRPQNLIASNSVLTLAPIPVERKSLDYIRNFLRPAFLLLLPL